MFPVKREENSRNWRNGKRKSMLFAIPMVWTKGKDHVTECYFCIINLKGINRKNMHHVKCSDIPSVVRPFPHVPCPDDNMKYSEHCDMTVLAGHEDDQPVLLIQAKLNDPIRDLNLQRGLLRFWVNVSKRNICWHQEQLSTGIETEREN